MSTVLNAGPSKGRPSMEDCCWVCLATESESGEQLTRPCACPRMCHLKCLARWQLQSAGKDEEGNCRFCHSRLPSWQTTLVPQDVKPVTPVMAIKFEGKTYKLKVKPGVDGLAEFQNQVRQLLGFDITDDFDVTFECSVNGEKMKLSGLSSYGAATQCAAITAAQRETKPRRGLRGSSRRSVAADDLHTSSGAHTGTGSSVVLPRGGLSRAFEGVAGPARGASPYQPLENQYAAPADAVGGPSSSTRTASPYRPLNRSATADPAAGSSRHHISLCGGSSMAYCDAEPAGMAHGSSSGRPQQSSASMSSLLTPGGPAGSSHTGGAASSRLVQSMSTDSLPSESASGTVVSAGGGNASGNKRGPGKRPSMLSSLLQTLGIKSKS